MKLCSQECINTRLAVSRGDQRKRKKIVLPSTSSRHKSKTITWFDYEPCMKTTLVPGKKIPPAVKALIVNGRASAEELKFIKVRDRRIEGPCRAHEQLMTKTIVDMFGDQNNKA